MRFSQKSHVLFALVLTVFCTASLAQPAAFADYDADDDGKISEAEFNQFRAERIRSRAEEGRAMRNITNAPAFKDFDADADGFISPEELSRMQSIRALESGKMSGQMGPGRGMGRNRPRFEDMDGDGNGFISEEELYRFRGLRMSERGMQGYPMRNVGKAPLFEDMDTDGDKRISPEEFKAAQQAH